MSDREPDVQGEDLESTVRGVEDALRVEVPDARREKAMFVAGVGAARRPRSWFGPLAPALAAVVLLVAIGIASRTAQPGQTLFPVRKVLGNVGLAPSPAREIRAELDRAEARLAEAAETLTSAPGRTQALVREAWAALQTAADLVGELDSDRRGPFERAIASLEVRAESAYEAAEEAIEEREEAAEEAEEAREDDSGGSGSGGDGDSSGSGSGGDDSSGSGSAGDDSSGSGSGGDDDSSGSGSGGDDSSGSGSGGDSSGPGSGDDD